MASNYQNKLKISQWNANGLRNKISELKEFFYHNNIDIMIVNETKLNSKCRCSVSGYTCYRKDRDSAGGGVLIYIKNKIPASEVNFNLKNIEAIGVLVNELLVVSAYLPPNKKLLNKELDAIFKAGKQVVLMGDLNAKHENWNCIDSNPNGEKLKRLLDKRQYFLLAPDSATHISYCNNHNSSVIDIALVKNISNCNISVINDLDSDHLPILLNLIIKFNENKNKKILDYSKANWQLFRKQITDKTNLKINDQLNNIDEVNKAVKNLTIVINTAMQNSIPVTTLKNFQDRLNREIKNLIKIRNKTRRKYQRNKSTN